MFVLEGDQKKNLCVKNARIHNDIRRISSERNTHPVGFNNFVRNYIF